MNSLIESLNAWGDSFLGFAMPMLWQSSLLIAIVFGFDRLLRHKIRPAVRYTLWFVVFVKLILPPSLALPTSAAWWLRIHKAQPATPQTKTMIVSYGEPSTAHIAPTVDTMPTPLPQSKLSPAAWTMLASAVTSSLLFAWLLFRWRQIAKCVRKTTTPSDTLKELLAEARRKAGVRKHVTLRLTPQAMSPAVCGLFRPVVLLPQSLVEKLSAEQLRAVLLHELIHLRRQDVWVNCAQTLLQIVYWWHPLLWFANARARRLREEAVDDAVMLALNDEAEIYAPTLLEVAKIAFNRPLASLGLIGILESRSALRQRIERLLNFTTPRRAGLSVVSILGIAAFTALAVPMGEAPDNVTLANRSTADNLPLQHSNVTQLGVNTIPETNIPPASPANPYARTNIIYTSPERQKIYKKLNNITFDIALYPGLPLSEVVSNLTSETRRDDPDHEGIHFTINKTKPPTIDPKTGEPIPAAAEAVDLSTTKINLNRELKNVRLMDLLDAIVVMADHPIKYSLLDSGVEFSARGPRMPELRTRTFKIGARQLLSRFTSQPSVDITEENAPAIQNALFKILTNAGIDLAAPKSIFFNYREGTLTVNATMDDLDLIERMFVQNGEPHVLLQDAKSLYELGKLSEAQVEFQGLLSVHPEDQAALYYLRLIEQSRDKQSVDNNTRTTPPISPPNLYTRTFKIDSTSLQKELKRTDAFHEGMNPETTVSNFLRSVCVSMQPPGIVFFNDRQGTLTVRASSNDLDLLEATINTLTNVPPQVTVKVRFVETDDGTGGIDAMLKNVLTNSINNSTNTSHALTGILTEHQFTSILKALQKRDHANLLSEGEVTLLSGRQAQVEVVDVKTVVNAFSTRVTTNGTVYGYETTNMPFGSMLDVVPTVLADGYTISIAATPKVTEFLGYEDPKKLSNYDDNLKHGQLPLPQYRLRQSTTESIVRDGQTLVIGNLSDEVIANEPTRAQLRRPFTEKRKKQLIVFITPTIIDASGNRLHSGD